MPHHAGQERLAMSQAHCLRHFMISQGLIAKSSKRKQEVAVVCSHSTAALPPLPAWYNHDKSTAFDSVAWVAAMLSC